MRKIAAFMAVGAIAILDVVPVALGQDKILIGQAFEPDLADLQPQALAKLYDAALAASTCRKLIVTHVVARTPTDPEFANLVAKMRETELGKVLKGSGLKPEQIEFVRREGLAQHDGLAQAELSRLEDREPPKLDTDSVPKKGTKVEAGREIKITMVARDHASRWQTGIQSMQLLAETEGNRSVAAESWRPQPRTCEQVPESRRLEATYKVPANPPPVVRLRAIAEDFANHHDTDLGEFPTGDWTGSNDFSVTAQYAVNAGRLEFVVDHHRLGILKGTISGQENHVKTGGMGCDVTEIKPVQLSAALSGRYDLEQRLISLETSNEEFEHGQYRHGPPCRPGPYPAGGYWIFFQPTFKRMLATIRESSDGSFQATEEWWGEGGAPGMAQHRVKATLKLQRAAQ